jgi:Tfp pilus assembly protein PilX
MLVALIVLVVMTMAGIALMRSMDTTNLIAGNMAFKQSATNSADRGIEAAIGWLEANRAGAYLNDPHPDAGYNSSTLNNAGLSSGEQFWSALAAGGVCYLPMVAGACSPTPATIPPNSAPYLDAAGNSVSFMIQRLCNATGDRNTAGCSVVSGAIVTTGNNEGAGEETLTGTASSVYYRITARVLGPRNTVSYVQAIVYL